MLGLDFINGLSVREAAEIKRNAPETHWLTYVMGRALLTAAVADDLQLSLWRLPVGLGQLFDKLG